MKLAYAFRMVTTLLLLWMHSASAQKGDFILTHHSPKHSEIDNVNFEITADNNGIVCIANRFGILKYDGQDWEFTRTKSSAISIAVSEDNTIYVGCISEFGRLEFKEGDYQYVTLSESDTISDQFLQTIVQNGFTYFLGETSLYAFEHESAEVRKIASGDFINAYKINEVVRVNTENGILEIDGFEASSIQEENQWGDVATSPNGAIKLAADLDGLLYKIQDEKATPLPQNKKINEAELHVSHIGWVNDSLVACGTHESGVFFIKVNEPDYFALTDYHSGLPDNEIYDMYTDVFGGVWVSHEFGLTRIDPLFPAYSYTNFPGLDGNLIEAQRIHGDLWVNTSLGVYYFSQDSSFKNKVYRERVEKATTKQAKTKTTTSSSQKEEKEEEKKGFLGGLFRKKNRAQETQKKEDGFLKKLISPLVKEDEKVEYIRRVERIVTGVSYQFHKVPDTEGKFRQLLETPDKIMATSHAGVFELSKESTVLVIDQPIRYAFALHDENKLIISTEDGYLKSYVLENDLWTETSSQYFRDVILNIYQDLDGHIWLAGTSHIYRAEFVDQNFSIIEGYEINNRFYDELSIWEHADQIYFINSQGYFRFDRSGDKIVPDNTLSEELGMPHHHLQNERSKVWLYNGKIWNLLLPDGETKSFSYLGIYPDLKYISYDETLDRYWLITNDNQLLSYSASAKPNLHENYKLFIKRISSNKGQIPLASRLELNHDQNNLSIELLKPDYLGILNPEYQYKLVGLTKDWSQWTHANLIDYSYIPSGKYELHVRARDTFGQLEETILLSFSVGTPYWKQPWFYAIQILILTGIVVITSKLDEEKATNRILKHALSILTLVVIIEFLQSVMGAYVDVESTPVIDFLIDVGTAILIFPLEWVLRKLMLEGGFSFTKKLSGKST